MSDRTEKKRVHVLTDGFDILCGTKNANRTSFKHDKLVRLVTCKKCIAMLKREGRP
jgi:hypothetical protein